MNIDFFKDLLQVLRDHITKVPSPVKSATEEELLEKDESLDVQLLHTQLHCIATAFELLSGQGTL